MRDEPLLTLRRLRRLALDEARLTLADCVTEETRAAAAIRTIEDAIRRETECASSVEADDTMVEAFAAWLRRIRVEQQAAEMALREAEGRTHEARAVLTIARGAVEAVEKELVRRNEVRLKEAQRLEQRSLDEIGARSSR